MVNRSISFIDSAGLFNLNIAVWSVAGFDPDEILNMFQQPEVKVITDLSNSIDFNP